MDPHDGLGCNAGGHQLCRFCGFGAYASIECPETRVEVEMHVEGTVEGFEQTAFGERGGRGEGAGGGEAGPPGVEKLALYVNQYVPLLMPVLASLAKKHAQAATGGK